MAGFVNDQIDARVLDAGFCPPVNTLASLRRDLFSRSAGAKEATVNWHSLLKHVAKIPQTADIAHEMMLHATFAPWQSDPSFEEICNKYIQMKFCSEGTPQEGDIGSFTLAMNRALEYLPLASNVLQGYSQGVQFNEGRIYYLVIGLANIFDINPEYRKILTDWVRGEQMGEKGVKLRKAIVTGISEAARRTSALQTLFDDGHKDASILKFLHGAGESAELLHQGGFEFLDLTTAYTSSSVRCCSRQRAMAFAEKLKHDGLMKFLRDQRQTADDTIWFGGGSICDIQTRRIFRFNSSEELPLFNLLKQDYDCYERVLALIADADAPISYAGRITNVDAHMVNKRHLESATKALNTEFHELTYRLCFFPRLLETVALCEKYFIAMSSRASYRSSRENVFELIAALHQPDELEKMWQFVADSEYPYTYSELYKAWVINDIIEYLEGVYCNLPIIESGDATTLADFNPSKLFRGFWRWETIAHAKYMVRHTHTVSQLLQLKSPLAADDYQPAVRLVSTNLPSELSQSLYEQLFETLQSVLSTTSPQEKISSDAERIGVLRALASDLAECLKEDLFFTQVAHPRSAFKKTLRRFFRSRSASLKSIGAEPGQVAQNVVNSLLNFTQRSG